MVDTKILNPLTLAFMGDAVYEQKARERIIEEHGSLSPGKLHSLTVERVRASYQANGYEKIKEILTEDEQAAFKRGRNSHSVTVPKSATPADYRAATGIEALFGYLFLKGEHERIEQLFNIIWED